MAVPEGRPNDDVLAALELEPPCFDPEELANTAIWPVVDLLSHRDWRREAHPGPDLQFPAREECNGVMTDVYLNAGCEFVETVDGDRAHEAETTCSVTIDIQTTATGAVRDYILDKAYETWQDINSQTGEDYTPEELLAKTAIAYSFNAEGGVFISTTQEVVIKKDGELVWSSEYSAPEDVANQEKIYENDLDMISQALLILTDSPAHEGIEEVVEAIRSRPMTVRPEEI